jgi:hypothetical protein
MLTPEYTQKVRQFEEQYGSSERCFSPDKHGETSPVVDAVRLDTERVIRVTFTSCTTPGGDIAFGYTVEGK